MARFLLSKSKLLQQYNLLHQLNITVSYSTKTNIEVSKLLEKETDSMFSIHSMNELVNVDDKTKVMFLLQATNSDQLTELLDLGIKTYVVDNETDLDTFIRWTSNIEQKVNLLLRMKLKENTIHTGKYFVFGMGSPVIAKRIQELKRSQTIAKIG